MENIVKQNPKEISLLRRKEWTAVYNIIEESEEKNFKQFQSFSSISDRCVNSFNEMGGEEAILQ